MFSQIFVPDSQDKSFSDENEVTVATKRFVIMDDEGKVIFSTSPTQTSMSSKKMKVSEVGGIQLTSSIETQNIRSGPGNSLSISSPVGSLKFNGPQKVDFVSFGGPINFFGLEDITFGTKGQGKITLNSGALKIPNLTLSNATNSYFRKSSNLNTFQLCSCADGKLFMAEPNSLCLADYHICSSPK